MSKVKTSRLRHIINRLARLDASQAWRDELNPTQIAVLEYLSLANRFSRSPSHVADYLGTTRGTVSQTFKSLERKGYVTERKSRFDKRSISFDITTLGKSLLSEKTDVEAVLQQLDAEHAAQLEERLREVVLNVIDSRGGKAFGMCHTCKYHHHQKGKRHCTLLEVELTNEEAHQICHEQR